MREILQKYKHLLRGSDSKRADTPMERDLKLRKSKSKSMTPSQREYVSKFSYQNLVEALLYLAINTRPNILYTVGVLARSLQSISELQSMQGANTSSIVLARDS